MRKKNVLPALAALLAFALLPCFAGQASAAAGGRGAVPVPDAAPSAPSSGSAAVFPGLEKAGPHTVYAGQPEITDEEMKRFISFLPSFRSWVQGRGLTVRPRLTGGKPDFAYPPAVGTWLSGQGWNPDRFFCVLGRSAAGMTIVSEGSDARARAADMPAVSVKELDIVRGHLAGLLSAFSDRKQ